MDRLTHYWCHCMFLQSSSVLSPLFVPPQMFHTLLYLEDIDWFEFRMKLLFPFVFVFFCFQTYYFEEFESVLDELLFRLNALSNSLPPKACRNREDSPVNSPVSTNMDTQVKHQENALFQTWQKCVFWKVSAVWTLRFCYRTLSEHNCQTRQWWVKQMSLPVKILYLLLTYRSNIFFPEPAQIVEPPLPNTKIEMT